MSSSQLEAEPLWLPEDASKTNTSALREFINSRHSLTPPLTTYQELYTFSISRRSDFWKAVWDFCGVISGSKSKLSNNKVKARMNVGDESVDSHGHSGKRGGVDGETVVGNCGEAGVGGACVDEACTPADNPAWFPGVEVCWAENMLKHAKSPSHKDRTALVQVVEPLVDEQFSEAKHVRRITFAELYDLVADIVSSLLACGLKPGDRVGSYSSNCIENVAACLATSAIGCVWASAAADFGPEGVLERFEQVRPKIVFCVEEVVYNGKVHNHLPKVASLIEGMEGASCAPDKVILMNRLHSESPRTSSPDEWLRWNDFIGRGKKLGLDENGDIRWKRKGFDWPLWVLFSSGTTGRPKPIVHRAGGMLLQALKELSICGDITHKDVFFYYTTTGWMMWNFLVSGLACGCPLVLYDGSPLRDPAFLWTLVDVLGITIFGTSAKYLDQLSKVYKPREHHSLKSLKQIYSTGSPLSATSYDYVYKNIHPNILLGSITGGTDICSLFAGMNTSLPVYRGELQCRMLGMAVDVFSSDGEPCKPGQSGELVCTQAFPCQPVGFWPLTGFGADEKDVQEAKERYQKSYFSEFKGIWYHGDHVLLTPSRRHNGGGLIMLGRSDGVLNPGGIRFGSAEIYDVIDMCFAPGTTGVPHEQVVVDCLAVGQSIRGGVDERVVLFVKLSEGCKLGSELEKRLRSEIRARRTARHVPERIIQVNDIPYTLNGKRVEVPVKKVINGSPVSSVNAATLRNPECLAEFVNIGEMLRSEVADS